MGMYEFPVLLFLFGFGMSMMLASFYVCGIWYVVVVTSKCV